MPPGPRMGPAVELLVLRGVSQEGAGVPTDPFGSRIRARRPRCQEDGAADRIGPELHAGAPAHHPRSVERVAIHGEQVLVRTLAVERVVEAEAIEEREGAGLELLHLEHGLSKGLIGLGGWRIGAGARRVVFTDFRRGVRRLQWPLCAESHTMAVGGRPRVGTAAEVRRIERRGR